MSIEKREAEPYDEEKVMEIMVTKGSNTIKAHLDHLLDHGEHVFLQEAVEYLTKIEYDMDLSDYQEEKNETKKIVEELFGPGSKSGVPHSGVMGGCPGSQAREFKVDQGQVDQAGQQAVGELKSELRQWPVQLHLLNPQASYFRNADVVLTADCVAYSMADFHRKYLQGRSLAIACPKLDSNLDMI